MSCARGTASRCPPQAGMSPTPSGDPRQGLGFSLLFYHGRQPIVLAQLCYSELRVSLLFSCPLAKWGESGVCVFIVLPGSRMGGRGPSLRGCYFLPPCGHTHTTMHHPHIPHIPYTHTQHTCHKQHTTHTYPTTHTPLTPHTNRHAPHHTYITHIPHVCEHPAHKLLTYYSHTTHTTHTCGAGVFQFTPPHRADCKTLAVFLFNKASCFFLF